MSKKRLVEVNMFSKLWDLFLNAKEKKGMDTTKLKNILKKQY